MKSHLKKALGLLLTLAMLSGMLVIVPTTVSAASVLPQARKNGTAKTPTAAQQSQIDQKFAGVVFWGDSLTAGTGTPSLPYVFGEYVNSNLISNFSTIDRRVNYGVGGENVQSICARANVAPATLRSAVTIPGSGSVTVTLNTTLFGQDGGGYNYAGISGATGPREAVINGVKGTFSGSGSTLTFTRSGSGGAVSCAAGTPVTFTSGNLYDNKNYIPVVYMGYNSGAAWCDNNFESYSSLIQSIINKYPLGRAGRYIVICPHFDQNSVAACKSVEAKLVNKFGNHVIKMREFMVAYGLSEVGISATATDQARIANGQVPLSLLQDDKVHYKSAANELSARLVYQKMYDLGYFNEVISILGLNISQGGGGGNVNPPAGCTHTLTAVPAKTSTCKAAGNKAYWVCSKCSAAFSDSTGKTATTVAAMTLPLAAHTYVNGSCTVCGAVQKIDYSVNTAASSALSQAYHFDLYDDVNNSETGVNADGSYGIGKQSVKQNINRTQVASSAASQFISAANLGSYATHHVFVDTATGNTGMSYLTAMPEGTHTISTSGTVSGDAGYVAYHVKGSSAISDLKVKINAGNLFNFRYAVYVSATNDFANSTTGVLNLSKAHYLGMMNGSRYETFYPAGDAKTYSADSSILSSMGNPSELYVILVLSNGAAGADAGRLSGLNTLNARITAVSIEATAGSTPPPVGHTHSLVLVPAKTASCKATGNSAYYHCSSCNKYFTDSQGNHETSLSAVTIAKTAHNYVDGICSVCGAAQSSSAAVTEINRSYDCLDFGKRGVASCVSDGFKRLTDDDAASIGAYAVHNVFVDGQAGGGAMTYLHPGSYDEYDSSYLESDNAFSVDFNNPSTVTGAYDFSYIAYKVSAGDGNVIKDLDINLYGALWPSVDAGLLSCRNQMAVYVTTDFNPDITGKIDFSAIKNGLVLAKGDTSQLPSAYSESDCYKISAANTLSSNGTGRDVYVIVVLFCGGWGIGSDATRASGERTGFSVRYTGIKINATAEKGTEPVPAHTHSMVLTAAQPSTCKVAGHSAYYYCSGCQKYFSDIDGKFEITLDSTVLPLGDHTMTESVVQPTETSFGYTVHTCSECGYSYNSDIVPPVSHTHTLRYAEAVVSTCKVAGHSAYYYCTGCQKYFSDEQGFAEITLASTALPLANHKYESSHVDAQGAEKGYTLYTCSVCFHSYKEYDKEGGDTPLLGDFDNSGIVDSDDAIYLLNNSMRPDLYPVDGGIDLDFNHDGIYDSDDALYLLNHVMRPDLYPLG